MAVCPFVIPSSRRRRPSSTLHSVRTASVVPLHAPLAAIPVPGQTPLISAAAALLAWFVAAPKACSLYYTKASGMKVSVRRIGLSGFRPTLHGVRVASPDDVELVTFKSVKSGGKGGVNGTARDAHFTVEFSAKDLLSNSWDVVRAAMWAPRIAFSGQVALTLRLRGEPEPIVDAATFDAARIDAARGGAVGAVTLVRALTQDALRSDFGHLPREIRRGARRLIREKFTDEAEKLRRKSVSVVSDMRKAVQEVDSALEGLPDLQGVRTYTRWLEKTFDHTSSILGGSNGNEKKATPEQVEPMPRDGRYRVLDEGSAY